MGPIRVGVQDENEIFRRGLIASLREDPTIAVVDEDDDTDLDLAIVSPTAARERRYDCPILACGNDGALEGPAAANRVLGVLPRAALTPSQLLGAVHAAAAGLRVDFAMPANGSLSGRSVAVLRLLAEGHDTRRIAREINCSERTVKQIVVDLRERLGARNRAQVVAQAIRQGMI